MPIFIVKMEKGESEMLNESEIAAWNRYDVDDKGFIIHSCKCSNCGWYTLGLTKAYVKKNFLHCPNCGKKMVDRKEPRW